MASPFNKFNIFVQDLGNAKHNLSSDVFKVMWTNTTPVATNAVFGDLTEITAGNGYSAGGSTATVSSWSQSSGTGKFVLNDPPTLTASGGTIGPLRYAVLYNSTQTSPNKPLIGWWDYGSSVTLNDGETILVDLDQTNGTFTVA